MTIQVEEICVEIQRKEIKHLYLRVKPPDGRVFVSAPRSAPDRDVEAFVRSRLLWIREKKERFAARTEQGNRPGSSVLVWGEPYLLRVETGAERTAVHQKDGTLLVSLRPGAAEEAAAAALREWYRNLLKKEAAVLFPVWEERMGLFAAAWQIKAMKTRWGTCNVRAGRIWLNLYLAEKPRECLEYVIVHELAHLAVPHHGKEFWQLVGKFLPDWKERRARLNEYGLSIQNSDN